MISLFQKSLDIKLAGSLFAVLCLVFCICFISVSKIQTSQVQTAVSQISGTLSQIETGKIPSQAHDQISSAKNLLDAMPKTLSSATKGPFLLVMLVCLILTMALMGFIFRTVFLNPVKELTLDLKKITNAKERDLTIRTATARKDQIGELANSLDGFISELDSIISGMGTKTETVAAASSEVLITSEQMDEESTDLSSRANSVAAAAGQMNASMHTVAAASEEAATNITMVADAAAQMQTNITGVARNCTEAREISNNALSQVETATGKVETLGAAAKQISKVTQVITDIAEQTDLLALNATIEAARAGESGKGFAVVASEIKSLASQTAEATQNIREKIESIQSSTTETVQEVGNISKVITHVDEIVNQIATAIDEQSSVATEVASNIEQASIGISEVNENVAQSSQVASEIANDISRVDSIASEMSGRVTQLAKGSKDLDTFSLDLRQMISMFKISQAIVSELSDAPANDADVPDLMPWTSRFKLNIKDIDAHHKELVRLVNLLHRAMRQQKGNTEVRKVLNDLAGYTVFHFGFEEELFQKYGYPEYENHKKVHEDLIQQVTQFQEDFKSGKATVTLDLMTFLTDWLKNHIMKTDKAYAPFLIEKMNA